MIHGPPHILQNTEQSPARLRIDDEPPPARCCHLLLLLSSCDALDHHELFEYVSLRSGRSVLDEGLVLQECLVNEARSNSTSKHCVAHRSVLREPTVAALVSEHPPNRHGSTLGAAVLTRSNSDSGTSRDCNTSSGAMRTHA